MITNSHSILTRRKRHFSQLLNVHGVNDLRQTEIHTAEPLVPEPNVFEVEMAIGKRKKSTNHQVLKKSHRSGLNQGAECFVLRAINLLIIFGIRRNCRNSGRSRSLYLFTKRVVTDYSNYRGIIVLSTTHKIF
jgi:hypothetical protein